jgi:hypothetical protein
MPLFRRPGDPQAELDLSADPALDDDELADARDATAGGDWLAARDLLARTGRDWDRKAHRVAVLAEDSVRRVAWVDTWMAAEPDNPDALTVRGHAEIIRGWLAREGTWAGQSTDAEYWSFVRTVRDPEDLCRSAAELALADPTPWASLLLLARTQREASDELWRRWRELRTRDPYHREGTHHAFQYLCARWHGSHGEMFDFVYRVVDEAPYGSPLAVLPLYAHAEYYAYVTRGDERAREEHAEHWQRPQIQADIDHALDRWLGSRPQPSARAIVDHNYLAHALVEAGRWREAAEHFIAIGPYATELPWRYTDDDPAGAFLDARRRALHAR